MTRTRWLTTKLVLLVLGTVVLTAGFTALFTWYRGPLDRLDGQFASNAFDFGGLALPAYGLFGLALGIFAGTLIRRTVTAMAATMGGFLALRIPVETRLRPHYVAPLMGTVDPLAHPGGPGTADWILDSGLVDGAGHHLTDVEERHALDAARTAGGDLGTYLHTHDLQRWLTYHPAGRYWQFQSIEAALFIGLAVILRAVTIWLVRRRVG